MDRSFGYFKYVFTAIWKKGATDRTSSQEVIEEFLVKLINAYNEDVSKSGLLRWIKILIGNSDFALKIPKEYLFNELKNKGLIADTVFLILHRGELSDSEIKLTANLIAKEWKKEGSLDHELPSLGALYKHYDKDWALNLVLKVLELIDAADVQSRQVCIDWIDFSIQRSLSPLHDPGFCKKLGI